MTSVTIPNSVTNIGNYAFYSCTSLSAITVDALNSFYSSLDGVLFNKSQTLLIQYPGGKAGSYTIPNNVTSIRDFAFASSTSLTSVTIGNGVTGIGIDAFASCTSLTSVMIGNGVTNIGGGAFSSCSSLASVTIGNGVTSIGGSAFSSCTRLTSITIPNSVTSIGDRTFADCTSLTSVTLPNSVTRIGDSAFRFCTSLTSVTIGKGVTSIGGSATTGWGTVFADRPAVLWNPLVQTSDASFGVRTNRFGFTITGTSNLVLVVEASANLANPAWTPVGTNTLSGGASYFSDPEWTNHPARFYRLRSL